jgi:diguanylate cyclase (GGDEF)-like protein
MREIWRHRVSAGTAPTRRGFTVGGRLLAPQDWPLARAVRNGEATVDEEIEIERGDGSRGRLSVNAAPIRQGDEVVAGVAVFTDVTRRRKIEQEARHLALHDPLTGLANRKLFEDLMDRALAQARRDRKLVAVALLDLDNFKDVNDTLGHPAGDQVLCAAARRIERRLRAGDTVARLGGDEFACILGDLADASAAGTITGELLRTLSAPVELEDQIIPLGASAGVALFPTDADDRVELLKNADLALYKAKGSGRNRYRFFERRMDREAQARKRLEGELRCAMAQEALTLHYQPQLDLASGRFTAAEALLRWPHPEDGFISPAEFIPVAEASGLIRTLGAWSVQRAWREARRWREQGLAVTMAINVSAAQLRHAETLEAIRATLEDASPDPGWIELELTESLLVDALEADTRGFLKGIVELGVPLAIDDFGTGYSSLAYLCRLPVQKIKIDRSFVHELDRNPETQAVVEAIVAMARALGKTIVAEGVETLQQLKLVKYLGCHMAQGYLLAEPLPPEAAARLLGVRGRLQPA